MVNALNDVAASIRREDYPRALLLLNRLHAARSADPELLGLYGYVNFKLGRFDKADSSIRKALRKRSQDPRLLNLLCNLQMKQGDFEGAKETARTLASKLDKAVSHGIIPHRRADRKKARIAKIEMTNEKEIIEDALGFLKERFNAEVTVHGEEDKARYDPKQRATLATPGQPAIYIE